MNVWHLVLCVVILALAYIFFQYARIRKLPEGTDEMQEMAGIIRDGASTFLKTEFRVIAIVVIVVAAVFSLFVEKTSGITFIMGACMSSVVCILGMRSAAIRSRLITAGSEIFTLPSRVSAVPAPNFIT